METILILFIVVGLPVTLGIGYAAYERHLKFKERAFQAISSETAEKARNMRRTPNGSNNVSACSNGS